jgi:hypothetical protein
MISKRSRLTTDDNKKFIPCFSNIALLILLACYPISKMTVDNEKYKLVEIYSLDKIVEKRAKMCTVCGRTAACCVWKSTTVSSS